MLKGNSKCKKIVDLIVKLSFIIIIVGGLASHIVALVIKNTMKVDLNTIFVSALFLIAYILTEKIYQNKFQFIPDIYYYITVLFAYLSVFLGSYLNFYEKIEWWDTMLHFSSGILIGLVSIIVVSLLITYFFAEINTKQKLLVVVIIGMLASLSCAVFWEFYEYFIDAILDWNMQRGIIVDNSLPLDDQILPYLRPSGRLLDTALTDTMQDMALATIGSLIALGIAYWPLKGAITKNNELE